MLVIKNARLFNGEITELTENTAIVIKNGKIKEIIPQCTLNFESCSVIDAGGRVVTPGFIDCHLHMMLDEIPDKNRQMNDQSAGGVLYENVDSYVAYRGAANALKDLKAGFTTVVDGGGVNYIDVALKDAIRLGYIPGPGYFISGKQLTAWPSHFRGLGIVSCGADGMRKSVREQIYYSVDQIKLEMSAPIRSVGRSLEKSAFTMEEITAATDEAHSAGLLVSAHARGAKPIKDSLNGSVDIICHGTNIDDEGIELMLKKGAYLLPTLASPSPEPEEHILASKSSRVIELLKATGKIQAESFVRAYRAGVKIALSTDAGGVGIKHGENAREMLRMNALGMRPDECLLAATSEAAKAMHLEDRVGYIKPGYNADLVFLNENPFEKLETVCAVAGVIHDGQVICGLS